MNAGIKMLFHNPLFGVGIDSYDDWYRAERGVISAFRTSFNRTANTAHNITLDLASGGGFPLLITYLILNLLVIISIWASYRKGLFKDPFYCAATCSWFAFQVQAQVSINQIGVGVWGWILSGIVIGYSKLQSGELEKSPQTYDFFQDLRNGSSKKLNTEKFKISASSSLSGAVLMLIGFTLAFLPFQADIKARQAFNSGDLAKMLALSSNPSLSSFFLTQAAQIAVNNNFPNESKTLSDILISRYPRNFYAWTLRLQSSAYSLAEQSAAKTRIKELDPNAYLCLQPNVPDNIVTFLSTLPVAKQRELLKGWAIENSFSFASLETDSYELVKQKIVGMCS
jgi:hypothetical protein